MNNARLYKTRDFECGLIFQTLRNKARLRQQDIAKMVGVGVNTVQYWESGTTYPKVETLKKLLEVYLRFEVFSSGQELAEAEELWEKVRQEAPRLNALFDREWFGERLASISHDRQIKSDQPDSLPRVPNNLPARLTSFVGRKKERAMLSGWLRPLSTPPSVRLVTLSGEGGCGKTSLALEIARELLPAYPQGVWLVELAPLSTDSGVTQTLAATFGLKEQANNPLLATITDYLREKRILLVLDNCEHLIKECARVVDSLLRDCPGLVVLATSREVLKVSGESVFRVPSLTLPPSSNSSISNEAVGGLAHKLMEYEAVQLFVERGKSASPHFTLNEQNKAIVAQLCRRLDGIPLAIELAAARLRVLSVFELNERLADRFRLLKSGSDRTVLPRQQTLRATIDWSYELLSQPERLLFRRLSVFAGGWTLEAAEEVCTLDGLTAEEIFDLLDELVNKSLVIVEEQAILPLVIDGSKFTRPGLRFRLLETLREYAQEQLKEVRLTVQETTQKPKSEKHELQARHLLYYTAFTAKYVPYDTIEQTYDGGRSADLLATEHSNLREALSWSIGSENQVQRDKYLLSAMQLALSTAQLWYRRSFIQEGHEYLSRLRINALEIGLNHTSQYGWICFWLGFFSGFKQDYKQIQLILEESLSLLQHLGDQRGIVRSLHRLGMTAKFQGENREAYDFFQRGLILAQEINAPLYIIRNLSSAGDTCIALGEMKQAIEHLQAGLKVAREYGDPQEIATLLIHLSSVVTYQGEHEVANAYLQETLPLLKGVGKKEILAACLGNLGLIAFRREDYSVAEDYFRQAIHISKENGYRRVTAITLHNLAECVMLQGNYKEATYFQQGSLTLFQELGVKTGIATGFANMGKLERLQGNYEAAAKNLQTSIAILWEIRDQRYLLDVLLNISNLSLDYFNLLKGSKGKENKAYRYLERGVRLAGITTNLSVTIGLKLTVAQQKVLDQVCETGQQQMGQEAFETDFEAGKTMTLEEAVAYALAESEETNKN